LVLLLLLCCNLWRSILQQCTEITLWYRSFGYWIEKSFPTVQIWTLFFTLVSVPIPTFRTKSTSMLPLVGFCFLPSLILLPWFHQLILSKKCSIYIYMSFWYVYVWCLCLSPGSLFFLQMQCFELFIELRSLCWDWWSYQTSFALPLSC